MFYQTWLVPYVSFPSALCLSLLCSIAITWLLTIYMSWRAIIDPTLDPWSFNIVVCIYFIFSASKILHFMYNLASLNIEYLNVCLNVLSILHVLHDHILHISKLIIHILCQYALAGKIGNERNVVWVLVNLDMVGLWSLYLLDEIWIQQDRCAGTMRGLLLFANFACEIDVEC
jgi:hypothetical protein